MRLKLKLNCVSFIIVKNAIGRQLYLFTDSFSSPLPPFSSLDPVSCSFEHLFAAVVLARIELLANRDHSHFKSTQIDADRRRSTEIDGDRWRSMARSTDSIPSIDFRFLAFDYFIALILSPFLSADFFCRALGYFYAHESE